MESISPDDDANWRARVTSNAELTSLLAKRHRLESISSHGDTEIDVISFFFFPFARSEASLCRIASIYDTTELYSTGNRKRTIEIRTWNIQRAFSWKYGVRCVYRASFRLSRRRCINDVREINTTITIIRVGTRRGSISFRVRRPEYRNCRAKWK